MSGKKNIRRKLILEGLIAFIIVITPALFYFYKYIPAYSKDSWDILWLTFTDNGYEDVPTAFFYYFGKLIPLILLIIWFTTCKHWWYHAILIPIAMYAFQSYSVFSSDVKKIDENEVMYLLAVCMIIIPIVYFIRVKLFDKHVHGIDLEAMEAELKALRGKQQNQQQESTPDQTINTDEVIQTEKTTEENSEPKQYRTLAEKIDHKLSTQNLESGFRQFQHNLKNWLHLKF